MGKQHNGGSGRGGKHRRDRDVCSRTGARDGRGRDGDGRGRDGDGRGRDGEGADPGRDDDRSDLPLQGGPDGDGLLVAGGLEPDVLGLREDARALGAAEAKRLRRVVAIAERCTRETMRFLALGGRVPGAASDAELVGSAVTCELMMALGIGKVHAEALQLLATRLVRVLPETLAMLESGRLDLTRARLLAEATEVLDDVHARRVQALVLPRWGAVRGTVRRRGRGGPGSSAP
jgi:hypothetical protein